MLEAYPIEAARVNVLGTLNVVQAAAAVRTKRFVFISSDKAVMPVSVMGASKRMAERLVLAHRPEGAIYSAVRFGNVLGSRGSVIPTFARQIAAGGPITVTDARMTRFFMSVEEAVQLVLQASVLASGSDIFMLEMGEPVRILDLAKRMVRLSAGDARCRGAHSDRGPAAGREDRGGASEPRRGSGRHLPPLHPAPDPLLAPVERRRTTSWLDSTMPSLAAMPPPSRTSCFFWTRRRRPNRPGDTCGVAGTNPDPVPA